MSADKRRRARVQGGWAAPAPAKSRNQPATVKLPLNTAGAACLGKTVDVSNPQKFVFQESEEVRGI